MNRDKNNLTNVLVVGSGGREHALAWKLSQSQRVEKVFVAPGNPGMFSDTKILPALLKPVSLVAVDQPSYSDRLIEFCRLNGCGLVVIGPEGPLSAGIVDDLMAAGVLVFGPSKNSARLESSKSFARRIIERAAVPSPDFAVANNWNDLYPIIDAWAWPSGMVIKADGLASGKGVFVCKNLQEARHAVLSLRQLDEAAGGTLTQNGLVCEERLEGREVSAFILCDGQDFVSFGMACDHKRLQDGDRGPNTGGMGAYSPVHWLGDCLAGPAEAEISEVVFRPVLKVMEELGSPFRGFLFAGLMITSSGPKVLEFNVRLGDPEAQVLLPRLDEDFFEVILAAAEGRLRKTFPCGLQWNPASALHVVKAAAGYPGLDGATIRSGDALSIETKHLIFYSGVALSQNSGVLQTAGGRILGVTAIGEDLNAARKQAYAEISRVNFEGAQWRTDIGK